MHQRKDIKEVQRDFAIVKQLEDRILENHVLEGKCVDVKELHELKSINQSFIEDGFYCLLITSGHLAEITKEARKLSASAEFAQRTLAKAFLVESLGHRIIGDFYIRMNKPFIKTKLFTDREKALEWLREQLQAGLNNEQ